MGVTEAQILKLFRTPGHPIAFSSPGTVYNFFKGRASLKQIKKALTKSDGYTLHRETRRLKIWNPYYILNRRDQIQADLIDMQRLSGFNDNVNHLLTLIDSFSRKLWVYPLPDKTGVVTSNAIKHWLSLLRKKPKSFYSDRGAEFTNRFTKKVLKNSRVRLNLAKGSGKAPIVERVNKTLQILIYKYLSEFETGKYIDKLEDIVQTYNKRGHRSLKNMCPDDADKPVNEIYVRGLQMQRFSKIAAKRKKPKFAVGDVVRVQTKPGKLGDSTRAYAEQAHGEYFQVIYVNSRMPRPMYRIKSLDTQEIVEDGFYAYELTKVDDSVFKMEVIDERGRGKKKEVKVRWLFFGPQHDSWIPASEVTQDFRRK